MTSATVYVFPKMTKPAAMFVMSDLQDAGYNKFNAVVINGKIIIKAMIENKRLN